MNLDPRHVFRRCAAACCAAAAGALLTSGCATNRVQAEWSDPQFTNHPLRGAKVLVVCDAADLPIKRLCEEQMNAQVATAGATPVAAPDLTGATEDVVLASARSAGAKAALIAGVAPDTTIVNPGPSVGFGVGGFGGGGGYNSTNVGVGVGVSVPVGSPTTRTGYAANMVFRDADSGRVMWTSKVSAPASQDINMQMNTIAKAGMEAARKVGVF